MLVNPLVRPLVDSIARGLAGREGGVASTSLVFHALEVDGGSFSADVIAGTGSITEARTSTIYLPDDSNVFQSFGSTVPGEYYAGGQWWLYAAPALTNIAKSSNDLTNSTDWAALFTPSRTFDQTGMTGAANTATILGDDDASNAELVVQIRAITASVWVTLRVFIKKDADTSRFPAVRISFTAGSVTGGSDPRETWHINTSTGAIAQQSSLSGITANAEIRDAGDWWEFLIEADNAAPDTHCNFSVYPAHGTVFGTYDAAAQGTCIIGNAEMYDDTRIHEVRGAGPIFTTTASVTTNATDISFDDANHDDTEGGYFLEFLPFFATSEVSGDIQILSLNGGADLLYYDASNSQVESADGTNTGVKALTTVSETAYKIGLAYGSGNMRVNVDGSWGTAVSYDSAYPTGTVMEVLAGLGQVGLIRNIRRYDEDYTTAQSTIDGLMA